jgi:glycosyltransferase involved in cell wall biosynthesis
MNTNGDEKPKLGVLELGTHENQLADFCRVAAGPTDVTVFTTGEVRQRIEATVGDAVDWVVRHPDASLGAFLSRVEAASDGLDALWSFPLYGTVIDYVRYARFTPDCPFIMYAFDLNGWVGAEPVPTPKVYNYLKYPLRRMLLRRIDGLVVEFRPVKEYAAARLSTPVHTYTPVLTDDEQVARATDSERTTITVPGMIDETRRDYGTLLDAFQGRPPRDDVELVLLGRPVGDYGQQILKRCELLREKGWKVTTFTNWIPTVEFSSQLARTDLLVGPLRESRPIDGFREYYGQTKGSGVISDALRYGLPIALPDWYLVPEAIEPATLSFGSVAELADTILRFATDSTKRQALHESAHNVASAYHVEPQRKRLNDILTQVVE